MPARYKFVVFAVALLGVSIFAASVQAGPKMFTGSIILHDFANDTTSGSTPPFSTYTFQALPLGANCNPANGGTSCGKATLRTGAPLTASDDANTRGDTPPYEIDLQRGVFSREADGSLPFSSGVNYNYTTARLENDRGSFSANGGPGSFFFVPTRGSGTTHISVTAGKNQFGGVMRLLGRFGTKIEGSTLYGGMWHGEFKSWGFEVVGGSYAEQVTVMGFYSYTSPQATYASAAVVTGFPWTTGRVTVSAYPTMLVRSGYDNRTSKGGGTLQMVSPRLTHWAGGAHWGDVAVMRLQFVPEPASWLMLAAGVGCLATLYRVRGSRLD